VKRAEEELNCMAQLEDKRHLDKQDLAEKGYEKVKFLHHLVELVDWTGVERDCLQMPEVEVEVENHEKMEECCQDWTVQLVNYREVEMG